MERKERAARNTKILRDYAAGATISEIARKNGLSHTAVSKILAKAKSEINSKKLQENVSKVRPPQAEVARDIVERATDALALMPFEKMHPDTLLKIIDRLTAIYGTEKEDTKPVSVNICFCDTSKPQGTEDAS